MTSVAKLNFARKQAGLPLIRFDLLRLNPEDVQDLRDAYTALYEISEIAAGDRRGYWGLARGHGFDLDLCHADNRLFLTWHRSYVYSFEKALNSALQAKRNDPELELTLPYWDWTQFRTATHAANGLPKLLNDATYTDAAGADQPNPLFRARSAFRIFAQGQTGDAEFTERNAGGFRDAIDFLRDDVDRLKDNPNFEVFQSDLDFGPHGTVHVRIGGDMGSVVSAAYDPLFWLHHCMVDKIWADWQALQPFANVPQHVLDSVIYDNRIGRDMIDYEADLRYVYSEDSVEAAVADAPTTDTMVAMPVSAAATPSREVNLGTIEAGFVRAQLDFHQLRPPKDSYEIRAYIDNPNCDDKTGYEDESYCGRLVLFGHGDCHGAPGHCNPSLAVRDKYDLRMKHPLRYKHTKYTLDLTRGLRRFIGRKKTVKNVKLYLVVLDANGKICAPELVKHAGCSLRTFAKK